MKQSTPRKRRTNNFHKEYQHGDRVTQHWRQNVVVWVMSSWYSIYGDSLRAGRSEHRISLGVRFSVPVQTGPATHLVSCTMGTRSLLGVKWPECGSYHPPRSSYTSASCLCLHRHVMGPALPLYLDRWVQMFSKDVLTPSSGNSEENSVKL